TAQSAFATSLATTGAEHDTTVLSADRNFIVAVADADRIYTKALTAADLAVNVAIAQRERDAVVAWSFSQRDASGDVLPQARYSVAVFDAALNWQRAATPQIQAYRDAIADQSHQLVVETADTNRRAERGYVTADEMF